jgi:hypothetical protein
MENPMSTPPSGTAAIGTRPPFTAADLAARQADLFALLGRKEPTTFERRVTGVLYDAVHDVLTGSRPEGFVAVSAATGSGKSTGAVALLSLVAQHGLSGAYVAPTIELADEMYHNLRRLLPAEDVAIISSMHSTTRNPTALRERRDWEVETDCHVTDTFTPAEFRRARIVVSTHRRWLMDVSEGRKDQGVTHRDLSAPEADAQYTRRDLVIVDEDPDLQRVYTAMPSDVARLRELLSADPSLDALAYGFSDIPVVCQALARIETRMHALVERGHGRVGKGLPRLGLVPLVDTEDAQLLDHLQPNALAAYISKLPPHLRIETIEGVAMTMGFLRAARQGRVFFANSGGMMFYAWDAAVPPQPGHLLLDGTADLNYFLAVSPGVHVVNGPRPDFSALDVVHLTVPEDFKGRLRPRERGSIMSSVVHARAFFDWLIPTAVEHLPEDAKVLLYAKKDLIAMGAHKADREPKELRTDLNRTMWAGRPVEAVNFGRGRGLNKWKDCTGYVRIMEFYPRRADVLGKLASAHGWNELDSAYVRKLSGRGAETDPRYRAAHRAYVNVYSRQDAMRTAARNLDDNGRVAPVKMILVGTERELLSFLSSAPDVFPGVERATVYGHSEYTDGSLVTREQLTAARSVSKREALNDALLATRLDNVSSEWVEKKSGIGRNAIDVALKSDALAPAVTEGWRKVPARSVDPTARANAWALSRAA